MPDLTPQKVKDCIDDMRAKDVYFPPQLMLTKKDRKWLENYIKIAKKSGYVPIPIPIGINNADN